MQFPRKIIILFGEKASLPFQINYLIFDYDDDRKKQKKQQQKQTVTLIGHFHLLKWNKQIEKWSKTKADFVANNIREHEAIRSTKRCAGCVPLSLKSFSKGWGANPLSCQFVCNCWTFSRIVLLGKFRNETEHPKVQISENAWPICCLVFNFRSADNPHFSAAGSLSLSPALSLILTMKIMDTNFTATIIFYLAIVQRP